MKFKSKIIPTMLIAISLIFLFSCGQTNTKQLNNTNSQNKEEKKYNTVISDSTNKLTEKIEDLEIEYTVWGCACPNWIRTKDNKNDDTANNYLSLHFYIEPSDKSLELPIYFDASINKLKLTGQFYEREDYPQGTLQTEEPMPKAKVFRYTKIEVIEK